MNLSEFCTCQKTSCPMHPVNHELGCSLCIEKNLLTHEIPTCYFNLLNDPDPGEGGSLEDFAALVMRNGVKPDTLWKCDAPEDRVSAEAQAQEKAAAEDSAAETAPPGGAGTMRSGEVSDYSSIQPSAVVYFGRRTPVESWSAAYLECCRRMFADRPGPFAELARTPGSGFVECEDPAGAEGLEPVSDALYAEVVAEPAELLRRLARVAGLCGVGQGDFSIDVRRTSAGE